jgi:amino acid transporter
MSIVVGTMVGTGIFIVPGTMARDAGSAPVVFLVWVAGGVLSLFGALTYAELGAAIPEAGGEYAYLRRGFGEIWGFLFGWTYAILGRPCSAATIAAGLLRFVSFLAPVVAVPLFTWHIPLPFQSEPYVFAFTPAQLYCALALGLVTFVNYLGVRIVYNELDDVLGALAVKSRSLVVKMNYLFAF